MSGFWKFLDLFDVDKDLDLIKYLKIFYLLYEILEECFYGSVFCFFIKCIKVSNFMV